MSDQCQKCGGPLDPGGMCANDRAHSMGAVGIRVKFPDIGEAVEKLSARFRQCACGQILRLKDWKYCPRCGKEI